MEIKTEEKSGITISRVSGEIDINTSPEFKKAYEQHIKKDGIKLVINFKEVPYIDSSGLATLVEILKTIKKVKGELVLVDLSEKLKGLFEITKLSKLFKIAKTDDEAVSQIT